MAVIQILSPRMALRAAMLKRRFAATIFKATHPTETESQIKAAEAASQRKEQYDLKIRRERERKAARMALQKMKKSVDLDKSATSILKDLEILFGRPVGTGYPNAKALEQLGLYMKKDNYLEEDEDAVMKAASRRKEQYYLKTRRDRARKAARMALEKMEKTVEVDQSAASILKDLEILTGRPVRTGYPNAKALERLGLYMKDRYLEEDEGAILDLEEGEILS